MPDHITIHGLADFVVSDQVARQHRAWAALTSLANGLLDAVDVHALYGFTEAELDSYRAEWQQMRTKRLHIQRAKCTQQNSVSSA